MYHTALYVFKCLEGFLLSVVINTTPLAYLSSLLCSLVKYFFCCSSYSVCLLLNAFHVVALGVQTTRIQWFMYSLLNFSSI